LAFGPWCAFASLSAFGRRDARRAYHPLLVAGKVVAMTNADPHETFQLIWSMGFLLSSVYVIWYLIGARRRARRRTSRTTGTVVRLTREFSAGMSLLHPHIEFVDGQGIKHLFKPSVGTSWEHWPVGSQVDVTYDPHDPTNCEHAVSPIMVAIMAVMFIPLWTLGLIMATRNLYDALQSMWG
jgi:hypothetical protein